MRAWINRLLRRPTPIENKTFHGGRIKLDGKSFVLCSFHDTEMEYSGGSVKFDSCTIQSPRFYVTGTAATTLRFLQQMIAMDKRTGNGSVTRAILAALGIDTDPEDTAKAKPTAAPST